jgi:hypothetical protein
MTVEALLKVISDEVGIKELTGKNDGVPSERYMGGRQEPWCAHFIAWAFRQIDLPLPGDVEPTKKRANPLASVAFMERVFKEAEWFYMEPKPGDVIFFTNRGLSDRGPGRHCGIVEHVDPVARRLVSIEGNVSNMVKRVTHSFASVRVSGYGRNPNLRR